ncbi:MAG TPA: thiolase family protein [Polyangiaceae bacterium]|nr:thiolase family protein [Polyangiaceae bacterium]
MSLRPVYLAAALRTPIGRHRGGLASVRPDDLAAHLLRAVSERYPRLWSRVEHVVLGATNQAGEDNRNVARMAALLADLPYEVPAVTVNRLCGSGLEAVCDAARRIATGDADVVLAGGVESMTRAPFVFGKPDEPFPRTPPKVFDSSLGWRFENPRLAARFPLQSMGETAENVAEKWGISRLEQDTFALESQQKAARAWAEGAFDAEVVPVPVPVPGKKKGETELFARDESVRADVTPEGLAKLAPVFRKGGSVTAGNSSPLNDGASLVVVVSEAALEAEGLTPLARIVSHAATGVEPNLMGEGPISAGKKALARAGWGVGDLDLVELNEAFAAQSIACIRGLELDGARVNPTGGAIALGHPIGSSGCRVLVTLAHGLARLGKRRGMAALCVGVGQGIAMTLERPA